VVERLTIGRLGHRGDGIADGPEGPIYGPGALPGETVEAEVWPGHPDRRQLVKVEMPSAARVAPFCPHFGVCGGCAVQHWQSVPYRAW
jgi:23S rRNA (uracil1939-C5)-methyltransferase